MRKVKIPSQITVAMMPTKKKITLMQMDGELTKEEFMKLLKFAKETCEKIYQIQVKTLKEKYRSE